jgi:DNA-binding Lrp family transcriptional regulator
LLHYSSNITPKWLTARLRQLEEAGIIEREKHENRREVWYKLTPAGQDLNPVVEALSDWGLRYAMCPPRPGEVVLPDRVMSTLAASMNKRGWKIPKPANWLFDFLPGGPYTVSFSGECWSTKEGSGKNPEVVLTTSPEAWATFLALKREKRREYARNMQITGLPESVGEFWNTFGATGVKT